MNGWKVVEAQIRTDKRLRIGIKISTVQLLVSNTCVWVQTSLTEDKKSMSLRSLIKDRQSLQRQYDKTNQSKSKFRQDSKVSSSKCSKVLRSQFEGSEFKREDYQVKRRHPSTKLWWAQSCRSKMDKYRRRTAC